MALDTATITALIRKEIPDAVVEADDMRGDGSHYSVTVTAGAFAGKSKVEQHRMVYKALSGQVADGSLHALQLTTRSAS
jgi:stress-induced morphogen